MKLPSEVEKDNLEAMDKLFSEKESLNKQDQNRYRYYEDLYGNEYRWTTHPQDDGKFKATILKAKTLGGWLRYTKTKERSFIKRKTAKAWCLKHCQKAKKHQSVVLDARVKRKQQRLDAKPKLTSTQISIKNTKDKIKHYETLQAKCDKKIKTLETRKKTYLKKIKYYNKRSQALYSVYPRV